MDPCFFSAHRYAPPRVFSYRLRPLSLGHVFLLHELESPYVGYEGDKHISDALLLVFICSQDHISARAGLQSFWLKCFFQIWCGFLTQVAIVKGLVELEHYLADGLRSPETRRPETGCTSLESPWPYRLLVLLMSELNMSRAEALGLPVSEAWNLWCSLAEAKGEVKLRSQFERDLIDYAHRQESSPVTN